MLISARTDSAKTEGKINDANVPIKVF